MSSSGFDVAEFNIDDPAFPKAIDEAAFGSGGFPFDRKLKRSIYERQLTRLQIELVKLQSHLQESGERIVAVFEGRDAAGKGGAIKRYRAYLNPRHTVIVALPKPSSRELEQWYFQRYAEHMPASGETVLFDRSWYNRAVVEPVMGFCTPEQTEKFLQDVPHFEQMMVDDGIRLFKFWLNIGQAMQLKRFHARRHDPLRQWKLSPIDIKAMGKWEEYTRARDEMLTRSHTDFAPWTVLRANDKRRARLAVIWHVLSNMDYPGKDLPEETTPEPGVILPAHRFLKEAGAED